MGEKIDNLKQFFKMSVMIFHNTYFYFSEHK